MRKHTPRFRTKLAGTDQELRAAQRLRYRVFVKELGGDGPLVDHDACLEADKFDRFFDHLILYDDALEDPAENRVVGVYRLLRDDQAERAGQFYSEDEYDLNILRLSGRKLLELGRSCVDQRYRGGPAMFHLWQGLAQYIEDHSIEVLFGVASFHGTDPAVIAHPLSLLHYNHLAPETLRVRAKAEHFQKMDLVSPDQLDRRAAVTQIPSLIKAYLRLGGFVGEGAFVDRAFNTTDVCLILDVENLSASQKAIYSKGVRS